MKKLQIELQGAVDRLNASLESSGYSVRIGHRNGYTAIDKYKGDRMIDYLDAGLTDRQALNYIYFACKCIELTQNNTI